MVCVRAPGVLEGGAGVGLGGSGGLLGQEHQDEDDQEEQHDEAEGDHSLALWDLRF